MRISRGSNHNLKVSLHKSQEFKIWVLVLAASVCQQQAPLTWSQQTTKILRVVASPFYQNTTFTIPSRECQGRCPRSSPQTSEDHYSEFFGGQKSQLSSEFAFERFLKEWPISSFFQSQQTLKKEKQATLP